MTIEQRPELNRYIDPDFIAPWQSRWRRIKLILPLWLFSLAWFAELMLLMAWSANRPLSDAVAIAIGGSLVPFVFIWVLMEAGILLGRRGKSVIQFEDGKIILGPSPDSPAIPWKDVLKFQFEPIPALPGMTKFVLSRSKLWKNRRRVERRMVVIENPVQARELADYLQERKTAKNYEIVVLNSPSPLFNPRPHAVSGLMMTLTGIFLFMHGMMFVLGVIGHGHRDGDGNSKFSPEQIAKIQAFWHQHFSTYAEFRNFSLSLGISLIFVGGGLFALGKRLGKNKPQTPGY